jgi:hypothetical protein
MFAILLSLAVALVAWAVAPKAAAALAVTVFPSLAKLQAVMLPLKQ